MKDIIKLSKDGQWEHINGELFIADEQLLKEEYSLVLLPKNAHGAKPFSNNKGIVWLDLALTKELEEEGIARDIVRFVQQARKEADFEVSDRIKLNIKSELDLKAVLENYGTFIAEQTLSEIVGNFKPEYTTNVDLDGKNISIELARVSV
jgi:isoleucyl-tRNA synthetase